MLFAYQGLSRILLLAVIDLFGSFIAGLLIWNWMQADEDSTDECRPQTPEASLLVPESL